MASSYWRGGLNDAKTRQQLDPAMREAYLELLKARMFQNRPRGYQIVRLVFEITPAFLEAARKAPPVMPDSAQANRSQEKLRRPGKATRKKNSWRKIRGYFPSQREERALKRESAGQGLPI